MMKVSEAIDQLEVRDTVWVKATVNAINFEGGYIRAENTKTSIYLDGDAEITLTEPQAEKVEARLAEHWHEDIGPVLWWNFPVEEPPYCGTPLDDDFPSYKTHFTTIDMPTEIEQPKRWVVRAGDYHSTYVDSLTITSEKSHHTISGKEKAHYFTDLKKAEAVALLVDGSVEEV